MGSALITRLVVFGATGDLAGRFLFPALARAIEAGELPADLAVVGAAPQDWDDETFTAHVTRRLEENAGQVSAGVRDSLVGRPRYHRVDFGDAATVARAVHGFRDTARDGPGDTSVGGSTGGAGAPVAVYLALPPTLFPAAVAALGTAALPPGSRIVVEKPFGKDLAGAIALNALLAQVSGGTPEAVFRVDHALAMPGVADLQTRRTAALDEAGWDSGCFEQVDILWEETIALEGRADFFDQTGVVRDVIQNHLLHILALVAMEPPATTTGSDLHRVKLDVLRSTRVHVPGDAASQTSRARYTAGELADGTGTVVPDYAREAGVDPDRHTETWAEIRLEVDQPRWAGTTFVLRAGKALDTGRKGVLLHLRGPGPADPAADPAAGTAAGQVWIALDRSPAAADPPAGAGEVVAYSRVLVDVLTGGSLLSVSSEEAEATWRIVEPVLRAWADGAAPLSHYRAGSSRPVPGRHRW